MARILIVDDDETKQSIYQYMFCDKSGHNKHIGVGIIDFCIKHTFEKKYTLDEMCKAMTVPVIDRNSAADDSFLIALLFLKLKTLLKIK